MVSYHALIVEMHTSDVDALWRLRELWSGRAVGIDEVLVNTENVEDIYDDEKDEDDLGEARAEETPEVEAVCMRDHDCLCAVMRTAKQHRKGSGEF